MTAHASRSHATWSASASARLWACPGSLKLCSLVETPEKESEAAAWGTACHEVAEDCLRNGREAVELIGRFVTTKSHKIEVDEEVAETAQVYVDYVRSRTSEAGDDAQLGIEQRFSLERLNPPFEAGGTADAVIYDPAAKRLEIVDLKGGRGVVVEAVGNKQLRTYALGALLTLRGLDVHTVKTTIVQPRAHHRDGRIRSEELHVADLMEWGNELRSMMEAASIAAHDFDQVDPAVWRDAWLKPGDNCRWCRAQGQCPALAAKAEAEARVWFKDESGEERRNTVDRLMPEEVARILDHADMIQDWLNAVRAYAQNQAESGVVIPGYQLVEKHGREGWKAEVEARVRGFCDLVGLPKDKFVTPGKLRTPKQIRDALAKAGLPDGTLDSAFSVPNTGTSLVRADKTERAAVPAMAQRFFTAQD
ncbi:DUF2800 domain-containing protein [Methylorubrum zatmanii]